MFEIYNLTDVLERFEMLKREIWHLKEQKNLSEV